MHANRINSDQTVLSNYQRDVACDKIKLNKMVVDACRYYLLSISKLYNSDTAPHWECCTKGPWEENHFFSEEGTEQKTGVRQILSSGELANIFLCACLALRSFSAFLFLCVVVLPALHAVVVFRRKRSISFCIIQIHRYLSYTYSMKKQAVLPCFISASSRLFYSLQRSSALSAV